MYGYTSNGYNAYKNASVKTASQGKLVVMLYEAAVRNLEDSIEMIDADGKIAAEKIEGFGNLIQKTEDIITELEVSLDMEKGGKIAENLMALYVYFNRELMNACMTHDKSKLTFIKNLLKELYDSWVVAANSNANNSISMPADRPALNITG